MEGNLAELGRARRLREVLAELPPAKRAVVVLAELEGLSMREVSEIVGANERTVRSRLRDARQKLVELLAD
ncbi:MAG: sigma-70 family RNA polymerase sigma factor, partial [Sorangiineae bacterium PRO1]|nr:sigma-70 family RNA polymerase sigma factor [Sorangiineae bacterium PRO1]